MNEFIDNEEDMFAEMDFAEFVRRFPLAAKEMMLHVTPILGYVVGRQKESIGKWGAIFAFDLPERRGRSMADIAAEKQISKATISHEANLICKKFGIQPSDAMKTEKSSEKLRNARNKSVKTARMNAKKKP
jgi:hypothetical protein